MPQPFQVDDLFLHQKITELDCAPDDGLIACTVRSADRQQDASISCIWVFAPDGSRQSQLTRGPGQDNTPRWSPDGRTLAFLSTRAGKVQPYLLARDGGEARPLGQLPGAVSDLRWAADGQSLLVVAAVTVDPDWRGERPNGREPRAWKAQPEVVWKLPYKSDGMGYMLTREIHLFRVGVASGDSTQLTDGPFDVLAFDASPDGRHVAHVRTREGRFVHRTDLWVCDAQGGNARRLTREFATVMSPRWSPDGRRIAFCATGEEGDAQTYLHVLDFASGQARRLGDDSLQVADAESVRWMADGKALLCVRAHRGRHQVVRVGVPDGGCQVLVGGDRQLPAFAAGPTHLAYAIDHPSLPNELHACTLAGGDERTLSDLNPWWRERTPILCEPWAFQVPDGKGGQERIEGWLLRAEGAKGPLPLLNDVHGGPASYVLLDFESAPYWHLLCSRGWAVLALNAVGSATYGREFCDRLAGRWGELDLPQHLAAIDQLVSEGVCDERLAIAGKSYGGYLAGWTIGHVNRFRAAVVMAPVGNIETHYGTSDGGYYADPYYMGSRGGFDRELARKLSPLKHVERATTPTLFLQGKEDERCPKCQAEELFVSLACAGETPAEMVLYPGQDHHFLDQGPLSLRGDAAQRIVDWCQRHVDRQPPPVRTEGEASTASSG